MKKSKTAVKAPKAAKTRAPKARSKTRTAKTSKTPPKVSILVPVYNVEKFLPTCLKSLTSQTLKAIEIICINDGSTDQSLSILKKFAKDPRIIIIDKENSGYGDSMNQGLKIATGEFIGIVESDDFADPHMFEDLYKLATAFDADLVKSNYYEFYSSPSAAPKDAPSTSHTNPAGVDILHRSIKPSQVARPINPQKSPHIFYQPPAIWSALYRRDFLKKNKINFLPTPGASYQDTGFNFKALAMAHRVVFTDAAYLHYRRDNESSSVKSLEKVFCVMEEYASIEQYLRSRHLYEKFAPILQATKFATYHWNMLRLPDDLLEKFLPRAQREFVKFYVAGELKRHTFPKYRHWLGAKLMVKHPRLFLKLFKYRRQQAAKATKINKS